MSALRDQIATADGKRRYVRALFATIADRYDLITVVLSYGQDRRWKERLVALAAPTPTCRVLDLATGTGDIAFASAARGARTVGVDITFRMVELATIKRGAGAPPSVSHARARGNAEAGGDTSARLPTFLVGDMSALPFPPEAFDLITTGYGLRNVPDLTKAIDEMVRVLRPGGRALSLDFNRPGNRLVRGAYLAYLDLAGGALGWLLHRDPDTYRYIPASIRQYPGAAAVARLMEARGFGRVRHYRVLGGLMAIHEGVK